MFDIFAALSGKLHNATDFNANAYIVWSYEKLQQPADCTKNIVPSFHVEHSRCSRRRDTVRRIRRVLYSPSLLKERSALTVLHMVYGWCGDISRERCAASQHGEVVVDHVRHVEEHAGGDVHEHEDLYQHGAAPAAALRLTTARQRSPTARWMLNKCQLHNDPSLRKVIRVWQLL